MTDVGLRTICVALTGASGMPYSLRLIERLVAAERTVQVLCSAAGRMVLGSEAQLNLPARSSEATRYLRAHFGAQDGQLQVFGEREWTAPMASGTAAPDAMVICPCTMGTLARVRSGSSGNLIERAADVVLKERRQLILVPRETPFSVIHLENMLALAQLGAVILPANPGFYFQPRTVPELVDFVVGRILDHLHVGHDLHPRWGRQESRTDDH